jgi:hypothetical protein
MDWCSSIKLASASASPGSTHHENTSSWTGAAASLVAPPLAWPFELLQLGVTTESASAAQKTDNEDGLIICFPFLVLARESTH